MLIGEVNASKGQGHGSTSVQGFGIGPPHIVLGERDLSSKQSHCWALGVNWETRSLHEIDLDIVCQAA